MMLKLYVILQHLCFCDIRLPFILLVLAITRSYLMGISHNVTDISLQRQLGSSCDLHPADGHVDWTPFSCCFLDSPF